MSDHQFTLELLHQTASGRDDIITSPANETALAMIDAWPKWPGSIAVLAGPVGSGKTHIASVWAQMADAIKADATSFSHKDELLSSVSNGGNILIEDMTEKVEDETGLFHLLNAVKEAGSYCLITSRTWPKEWQIQLPDLKSRLLAAQLVELSEPDDLLIKQVMAKLFADRQLQVEQHVIDYCVLRMERSLESAARLVNEIDAEALSRQSLITRATAAAALKNLNF
jgi:chromosomal replication initiation ATPase DnaA